MILYKFSKSFHLWWWWWWRWWWWWWWWWCWWWWWWCYVPPCFLSLWPQHCPGTFETWERREYTEVYRVYSNIQSILGYTESAGKWIWRRGFLTNRSSATQLLAAKILCFNMISRNVRQDTFSPTRIYFLQLVPTRPAGANCWEVIAKLSLASTSSRCVITMHIAQFPLCTMHFEICSYFNQE